MNTADFQLFRAHPDPMWICDAQDGTIVAANPAALAAYGYDEAAFQGMTVDALRADQADPAYAAWAGATGGTATLHKRADGSPLPVTLHDVEIRHDDQPARLVIARVATANHASHALAEGVRETLENMSDGLFLIAHDGRFTFVNRAAEQILGFSAAQLIGHSLLEVVPDASGSAFVREASRAMSGREATSWAGYFEPFDAWFEMRAYPGRDGVMIYFRNTTAERAQREQLLLLESAVARLNDIVIITEAEPLDTPGPRIIYVNDAFEQFTGYRREDVLGHSPRLLQGPATERDQLDRIREALRLRRPVRVELTNYTRAGEEFRAELEVAPIFDADGRATHFVAVQRDITERGLAERALAAAQQRLRESEERFRIVAQTTADVVWDWNVQEDTVWRSEGLQAIFGPEARGTDMNEWRQRLHPEDRARVLADLAALLSGAEDEWLDEYRFQRFDGSWARIKDRGSVIRDESAGAIRVVGSMVDITEQRELEEKLQRSQRLDAIGQLTGGVAHDFNNLLTVILGNSEMLAEQLADDERLQLLATMTRSAAERGAELTRRLLAFARRQALDPNVTDVNELVAGMYGLLRRTLGEHIDIELLRAEGLWEAMVDGPQLESALLNLCLNARDAMPDGGRLAIATTNVRLGSGDRIHRGEVADGEYVTITVSDTGLGMPAEIAEHAFEPFFTTKETGKGSGLGLSMVYGFVKQSSGHVRIESQLGEGTVITLYLPRAAAHTLLRSSPPTSPEVVGGSESILLVEDDDVVRPFVASQLQDLGYQVVSVANGPQAMRALAQRQFDLLFTDIVMPGGMNGRELADAALALRPDMPVLFTSGYTEDAIGSHVRDGGIQLLHKPYRRAELAAKVRQMLGRASRS